MFKTNQLLFVKNLQKEVGKLTNIVKTVIQHSSSSKRGSENVDLYSLQDSIETVNNNLKNYFTRVTNKSIDGESYFSGHSDKDASIRRKCKSQLTGENVNTANRIFA